MPGADAPTSLHHSVRLAWDTVHVVGTVRGKAVRPASWRTSTNVLMMSSLDELGWWNFAPQPVPTATWTALGLDLWRHPRLDWVDDLQRNFAVLTWLIGHAESVNQFPEPDDLGTQVLLDYAGVMGKRISTALQAFIDAASRMLDFITDQVPASGELRPDLKAALEHLQFIWDGLKSAGIDKDQLTWQVTDLKTVHPQLQTLLVPIESLRLVWLRDVIETPS